MKRSIPVLYYHRVGAPDPVHLSVPVKLFDKQMSYLARKKYNVITASELKKWIEGEFKVRFPAVCITFDDGFLDNYRYAHEILEKYNFRASLFIATTLIRPETQKPANKVSPFNEAHTMARRGDYSNFLSQNELIEMRDSGLWEIYSHSHNHNQVFTSDEITGSYPETDNHWGVLSAYDKPLAEGKWPVYKRNAGLVSRAMKVSKNTSVNHVELIKESESEFEKRVEKDLNMALDIVKTISPDLPNLICWPWGKTNEELESIAKKCGYVGAFRTDTGPNYVGMNPMKIKRFPVKKKDIARFSLGVWLRSYVITANIYAALRNFKI